MSVSIDFSNPMAAAGGATGAIAGSAVEELRKALDSGGYGTDVSQLTGGAALRIQSLDKTMQVVIAQNKNFRLFNRLPESKPGATVDEWTEQNGVGGFPGGSTNTETGIIADATGSYARRVGQVKYLMTRRQVSFVETLVNNIVSAQTTEYNNGTIQLLSDAEYLMFEGNSAVIPTEFDGIDAQMQAGVDAGLVDGTAIMDARGNNLTGIGAIADATANISGYGNFGTATDIFWPPLVQSDMDKNLDPAFRVALDNSPNSIAYGTSVRALRTSNGDLATNQDVFIRDEKQKTPFELRFPAVAAVQASLQPSSVTMAQAVNVASLFAATQAGNYFYLVAGTNAAGTSVGLMSAQVAIGAGQANTLTINSSVAGLETGYVIYRSRLNGTNALADLREMCRIPRTSAVTTYVDLNRDLPGTARAYILNLTQSDTSMVWRQLLPMVKFQLYPTASAVLPWAQMMFGYLRISKRKHHAIVKNLGPGGRGGVGVGRPRRRHLIAPAGSAAGRPRCPSTDRSDPPWPACPADCPTPPPPSTASSSSATARAWCRRTSRTTRRSCSPASPATPCT